MVKKIEDLNYYELLEITPSATSQDVHRAYERVRRIYEPNSIALYSLFSPEETSLISRRIEDAYRTLMYEGNRRKYDDELKMAGLAGRELPPLPGDPGYRPVGQAALTPRRAEETLPPEPPKREILPPPVFNAEFTGPAIKLLREQRNMTLRDIADMTKIGVRYLELIEEENFKKVPVRPYLRGFLMLYAKTLGYEPEKLASDYLKRYDAAMNTQKK